MYKLLSANLSRLWINKAFWLTVVLMICLESICCLLLSGQDSVSMDYILFISLQGIGILTSVFFSLFLGDEYSDGTIRNKIIVGHKRENIYLASFITGIIAVTVIYLAGVLTGIIIGIILFPLSHYSISQIMLAGVIGWLACVSYVSIFNLIGMISSSKVRTSIICILTAFILMFVALTFFALLSGSQNVIYQFLFEFNPFGQTVQAMLIEIDSPEKQILYSLFISFIPTGLGVYIFSKKDLK